MRSGLLRSANSPLSFSNLLSTLTDTNSADITSGNLSDLHNSLHKKVFTQPFFSPPVCSVTPQELETDSESLIKRLGLFGCSFHTVWEKTLLMHFIAAPDCASADRHFHTDVMIYGISCLVLDSVLPKSLPVAFFCVCNILTLNQINVVCFFYFGSSQLLLATQLSIKS